MFLIQLLRIVWAVLRMLWTGAREKWGVPRRSSKLPKRLREMLEWLGPTFIKLGQALSLRRDLLPEEYVAALRDLQDHAVPFASKAAVHEIEIAFGKKINELFANFEQNPLAAASIAQVHCAEMHDGRRVIVKIRRPGIGYRIDRDMRALVVAVRWLVVLVPRLDRLRPIRLVEEVWANLRKETDFRKEAGNIKRFAKVFEGWAAVNVPCVVDDLYTESVLVQDMSGGHGIADQEVKEDGRRLAQVLIDAYLHQLFVAGLFHGDPHPGNLFVMKDGRLCFHDLGLVGTLDRTTRRNLAMFVQAFVRQDAGWVLDTAIDLGILGGEIDRPEFTRGIDEILADYSARPIKEWSMAEALVRVSRLGKGENFSIPHNLLVLMRAMFLVESALRTLDPDMNILDTLIARGKQTLETVIREGQETAATERLKDEAALMMQDLPLMLASWLHKLSRGEGMPRFSLRHEGLEGLESHLDRSGNRLSIALVTLGLYIAGSLLMQHSIGPRLFGELPLLAAIAYALALWFTFRLANGIRRSGRL